MPTRASSSQFRDPDGLIGFPIVNEGDPERLLTGADIDPESLQRGRDGDLWVGDEFGPWILHFDADGRPARGPDRAARRARSPNNPCLGGRPGTVNGSRGIEGMAMSPNGRYLYVVLEGAVIDDAAGIAGGSTSTTPRRHVHPDGRLPRPTSTAHFIADAQALDNHRLAGHRAGRRRRRGSATVYEVDLREVDDAGYLRKTHVVDLAAIPDPEACRCRAIHDGDVGLGDPFRVTCESVEALRIISRNRLLVGCDNNFPNRGRNPNLADDNEFIVVRV